MCSGQASGTGGGGQLHWEGKMGSQALAPRPDISGWEVARPGMGVVLEAVTS